MLKNDRSLTGDFLQSNTFCVDFCFFLICKSSANIISISHGCALGWLSPYLPLLQSDASPLANGPISLEETSWIGAILCVGGVIGNSIFGYLCKSIGRKRAIILLALPNLVWIWTLNYVIVGWYHWKYFFRASGCVSCSVVMYMNFIWRDF